VATTFQQVWNYLLGIVPELSPLHAQTLVNLAWEDIRDDNGLWSFLNIISYLNIPAAIVAGTVTATQDSTTVTADATAKTALDVVAADIINRYFRVTTAGAIYGISAYDNTTGVITLDRDYQEDSGATLNYQVYKPFFPAPVLDFRRWEGFVDPVRNWPLVTNWTKDEIDARDPQRAAQGDPLVVAAHSHHATTGYPMFELWPHPVNRRSYDVAYVRRGTDLSDSAAPPEGFKGLLIDRAEYRAYEWAEANKGRFPVMKDVNWPFLMGKVNKSYQDKLVKTKSADRDIYNRQWANSRFVGRHPGISMMDVDLLQQTDLHLMVR
jgi:hypothetical protein